MSIKIRSESAQDNAESTETFDEFFSNIGPRRSGKIVGITMETGNFPKSPNSVNSGDRTTFDNFRPVFLTSNIFEIFQKIIQARTIKFLDRGGFLLLDNSDSIRNSIRYEAYWCPDWLFNKFNAYSSLWSSERYDTRVDFVPHSY
ncbi:hypothetical protein WA026_012703 [Henosepilachna vigintioctopunctata]|uniref:Uncharacterized protein n=1 Tax=Henosepilachna vigintioctopunctata TaxID=420089 RepID=A0AAW1U7Z3_9CUCU